MFKKLTLGIAGLAFSTSAHAGDGLYSVGAQPEEKRASCVATDGYLAAKIAVTGKGATKGEAYADAMTKVQNGGRVIKVSYQGTKVAGYLCCIVYVVE